MKILLVALLFSAQSFATLNLQSSLRLECFSSDGGVTIDSCKVKATMGSTDSSEFNVPCNDEYTLTAGQQTDIDAILVSAVANTKTVHSIP